MSNRNEIIEMILDIVEMEQDEIGLDDQFTSFDHIDSISALDILTGLERILKVKIPEKEIRNFTSIQGVLNVADAVAQK